MQFITQGMVRKSMLTVDGLLWMRELAANAAKAGATKSPAKSAASRANGPHKLSSYPSSEGRILRNLSLNFG